MKRFYTLSLAGILLGFSCTDDPSGKGQAFLPDLNLLFEDYEKLDSTGAYAAFANTLIQANRHLKSSELYVEAASLYAQAGNSDSVAILLNLAIDQGMANPKILTRLKVDSTARRGSEWERLLFRLDSIRTKLHSLSHFSLESKAMRHFWPYLEEALKDTTRAKTVLREYILSGPPEVRDFYAVRYYNVESMYGQMINAAPTYYRYLRDHFDSGNLKALSFVTTRGMQVFQELYPPAVFPKVYIVPGILNSGGTATEMGLFVGGDMYGISENTPREELTEWQVEALMEMESLPGVALHELMHFQQNYDDSRHQNSVLLGLIQEGVCDLLVELCTGNELQHANLEFLSIPANRERILADLRQDLYGEDLSRWMYNGGSIHDRPHDLGYTLGYLITKSYYERQPDKKAAVYELLNSKDLEQIVRDSEFAYLLDKGV